MNRNSLSCSVPPALLIFVPSWQRLTCQSVQEQKSICPLERQQIDTWLSWRLQWWRICFQCRRPGFNPWYGKMPWRREWQPTPLSLPAEIHGQRSLAGYNPWIRKESDTAEWLTLSQSSGERIRRRTVRIQNLWFAKLHWNWAIGWGLPRGASINETGEEKVLLVGEPETWWDRAERHAPTSGRVRVGVGWAGWRKGLRTLRPRGDEAGGKLLWGSLWGVAGPCTCTSPLKVVCLTSTDSP